MASYSILEIPDFSGGWNPRDAWGEVDDNELIDMMNFTLDKRGSIVKRLGYTPLTQGVTTPGETQNIFYSKALDKLLAQFGNTVYVSSNGGVTFASLQVFSTTDRVGFCDFLGKTVIIHPVDRAFSYDGASMSSVITNSPKGNAITVWQNAMWSCGDPTNPSRVTRSDLGAITWPASPVTNDVRVKDDQPLTAIGGGQGMDVSGRSGVLVFKENSTYRIHSISDGAYTVVDATYGASGPLCVTTNNMLTAAISRRGIISTKGDDSEPTLASYKIEPLFRPGQLTHSVAQNMAAGNYRDRMVFSIPWDTSLTNNLTLEYHPNEGWFTPHSFGFPSYTQYTKNTEKLYAGSAGTGPAVLDVFTSGSDGGTAISCRAQTKWFEKNMASEVRFRRAVINGRGNFGLYVKGDFDPGAGELFPIELGGTGDVWGSAVWGYSTWGFTPQQDYKEIFSLGHFRAISFEVQETSSLTYTAEQFLDTGGAEIEGAMALYGITVDTVPLGRS